MGWVNGSTVSHSGAGKSMGEASAFVPVGAVARWHGAGSGRARRRARVRAWLTSGLRGTRRVFGGLFGGVLGGAVGTGPVGRVGAVCALEDGGVAAGHGVPGKVRVMVLISDTGGGHRASADALKAAFEDLFPGQCDIMIVDFWTEIAGRPFDKFPEGYSFLAKNPPLWRCAWNYGRFPLTRRITEEFSNVVGNRNFRKALGQFRPDLIVSLHPLTQFIPLRVLRTLPERPPFVTVCTDLGGAHPTWFHKDVDLCFIPSDSVRKIALRCGLLDSQLRQFGLPVREPFWYELADKSAAKRSLGLDDSVPTVLIVGGGDGVGGVGRIAIAMAERIEAQLGAKGAQIVVVCGKNMPLLNELNARTWPVSVHVRGFVSNMSDWMAASDLIVSKAGPGTIAEALIRGLPIVLSGFLPGQEAPNVNFVTTAGVGEFSRDPVTIANIVTDWVSNPIELAEKSRRAKSLGRPSATYDIVREIATLVDSLEPRPAAVPVL